MLFILQPLEELFDMKLEQARQTAAKASEMKRFQTESQKSMDEIDGDMDLVSRELLWTGLTIVMLNN